MYFIFWGKWQPFCFWKEKLKKKIFLQILRGEKSKIGFFYEFIPAKSAIFGKKFMKKISQLWCPGNQCGQLRRFLKIWVGIVPYDGYQKLASCINYLLKLWILASKIEDFQLFCLFNNKYGRRKIENICKILLIQ